jgi:hypothetical protein
MRPSTQFVGFFGGDRLSSECGLLYLVMNLDTATAQIDGRTTTSHPFGI